VRPTLIRLAVVATAALALTACGDKQLDVTKSEQFIRGVVVRQIGVRVATVRCPDAVKAKKGEAFTCVVTGRDGSTGRVNVGQTDEHGNIAVTAPFLHMREVEATMQTGLSRQRKTPVTVSCQEIVVVKKGDPFECTGTAQGRSRAISARLTDDTGRFRYHLR